MSDHPVLSKCICGKEPHFGSQFVPVFDKFDKPYQPTIWCYCGLTLGPNGNNEEGLAKQWNELMWAKCDIV